MNASFALGIRRGFLVLVWSLALFGGARGVQAAGWFAASSPVTDAMFGMDCMSGTCIQVGVGGTVVRTTDYQTWTEATSGVTANLLNVDMYSSTHAFVVGASGTLLKTTDGGVTWTNITGITSADLLGVSMVSTSIVYIAGQDGAVHKTIDGGTTWVNIGTSLSGIDAYTIDAYTSDIVYVAGAGGVAYKTTDGGSSWTLFTTGTTESIYTLDVTGSTTAYIAGSNGMVKKTTDGTTFATHTLSGFESGETVKDVVCSSSTVCLLAGDRGHVASTTNGSTWSNESMPSIAVLGGVANISTSRRFVSGAGGAIFVLDYYAPNDIADIALSSGGTTTTDTTPEFTWTAATDDESWVASYEMEVDGSDVWTDVGNVTTYALPTALAVGSHSVALRALDEVGNMSAEATFSFTVESTVDSTAPTLGSITSSSVSLNGATAFTVTVSDDVGISSCTGYVDTVATTVEVSGSTGSFTYTFTSAGSYSVYATCTDAAGNVGTSSVVTVTVASDAVTETDSTPPTVGAITPVSAEVNVALTLYASVSDSVGMGSCTLYVNSTNVGSMTIADGYAQYTYTFTEEGDAVANAYCTDAAGNATRGDSSTIAVAAVESTDEAQEAVDEAEVGSLIKLACENDSTVEDVCRAVYYIGSDGKRHAFPNGKVFFTWYEDFDDVVIVTDEFMASLTLGANVTYHPGVRMVKFVTQHTVYGVGEAGELRAIASEDVAESIWGSVWNTLIDDISDAFYGNYTFGEAIDSTSDFDPEEVEDSVTSIDEIL